MSTVAERSVRPGVTDAPRKRVSPARALGLFVLGSWCGLFWFLMLTDRVSLYLSPRTAWVVPVGAAILSMAVLGRVLSLRVEETRPIARRDALGAALIVFPVVALLALPPASLGAFAVSRRSTLVGAGFSGSTGDISEGELSLLDVASGLRSREAMDVLVARAGEKVDFTGFVALESGAPADQFQLTRFLISCCAADALSVQVRVAGAPPGQFKNDEWVRVTGTFLPLGREVIVNATEVEKVERPEEPYLSP